MPLNIEDSFNDDEENLNQGILPNIQYSIINGLIVNMNPLYEQNMQGGARQPYTGHESIHVPPEEKKSEEKIIHVVHVRNREWTINTYGNVLEFIGNIATNLDYLGFNRENPIWNTLRSLMTSVRESRDEFANQ